MQKKNYNKSIYDYTLKELRKIENFMNETIFDSFVILPEKSKHDSGFQCMSFILLNKDKIVGKVCGRSDVLHLNGIGGYGKDILNPFNKRIDWNIDCLPKSKLLRFWSFQYNLSCDEIGLSDFSIYVEEKRSKGE